MKHQLRHHSRCQSASDQHMIQPFKLLRTARAARDPERKLDVAPLGKVPFTVHNPSRSWKDGQHDQPRFSTSSRPVAQTGTANSRSIDACRNKRRHGSSKLLSIPQLEDACVVPLHSTGRQLHKKCAALPEGIKGHEAIRCRSHVPFCRVCGAHDVYHQVDTARPHVTFQEGCAGGMTGLWAQPVARGQHGQGGGAGKKVVLGARGLGKRVGGEDELAHGKQATTVIGFLQL
ncbi:MAG: hypothetical protein FRX49_09421 [Trebouxia sp. A1-2]|nr:MAG: hypothetical protein FRX49_09421 [Trebouxia sp. A1-2]